MNRLLKQALVLLVVLTCSVGVSVAAPKGKITIGLSAEPSTFDPHRITGLALQMTYPLVFDNLFNYDYNGKLVPRLAKSHRLVNPTTWEFKIREGIKFSNGEPLDAHAVKFSLERILDPKLKSRQRGFLRKIKKIEVADKYTVRIQLKQPDMFLIPPFAFLGHIVPPKYYQSHDLKYLARHPIGSGPYRLVRWKKGEELVFEANPHYWRPGVPRVKTGVIKVISEPNTRVSALVAGDVDIIEVVPPQLLPLLKANPKIESVAGRSPRTCRVIMIIKLGSPWADVRVRKALNYGVDKESIVKNVLQGYAKPIATNIIPKSFGYNPALKPYPYDPARAKKLLKEAGYPNGFDVDMFVPHGRYLKGKEAAEAMAGQLAKVGVRVQVKVVNWGRMVKRMKGRWEARSKPFWWYGCRMNLFLHSEGMHSGAIYSKSVWTGFRDKEVDKLLDDARSEPDDAKRESKYKAINRILHSEKVPMIFLYQVDQINAKKKRVDWKMRPNALMLLSDTGWKK